MRTILRASILSVMLVWAIYSQTTPSALLVTRQYNVTSVWAGEGSAGCDAGVIDNRSSYSRRNTYHSYSATGSGNWQVDMQYSDTSCAGPWTSYGAQAVVNQASNPAVGYGNDPAGSYHPYIKFVFSGAGAASVTVTYSAAKDFFLSTSVGAVVFPCAVDQGCTGAATAAGARINLGAAASGANADITNLTGLGLTGALLGSGASGLSAVAAVSPLQYLRRKPNVAGVQYEFSSQPTLSSADYNFPAQSPPESLIAGGVGQSITLTPCPLGVAGADTNHYLRLTGANAESVLITGGTCTSGAASGGTVTFTPANSHTAGAYTVVSATAGIQEAANSSSNQVFSPPGIYELYATVTFPTNSAGLAGSGTPGNTTTNGTVFRVWHTGDVFYAPNSGNSAVEFRNFQILWHDWDNLPGAGTGIHLDGNNTITRIDSVVIDGTYNGIYNASSTVYIDHALIQVVNRGIIIGDGVANYGGLFLDNSNIINLSTLHGGVPLVNSAGIYIQGSAGGAISNTFIGGAPLGYAGIILDNRLACNEFAVSNLFVDGNQYGVVGGAFSALAGMSHWTWTGCQFNITRTAFALQRIAGWRISTCRIGFGVDAGYSGIDLGVAANDVVVTGNSIYPSGAGGDSGINISADGIGLTITGNNIRPVSYEAGGAITNGIKITGAMDGVEVGGNNISATNPLVFGAFVTHLNVGPNNGVDNVTGTITVSGGGAAAFPVNPHSTLDSATEITSVSGLWAGRSGTFVNTNAAPGTWTAGATIGNTLTPAQNMLVYWWFDGTKIWLGGQDPKVVPTGPNYITTETGADNAIAGALPGAILAAGLRVTVLLAHALQAGANTFDLNAGGAVAIKSSRNVANDIGTAYAAGGTVALLYDGTRWVDVSQ